MELKGYTNIPDWMLSLDLDVYETIILAVIYGFSQDGESTFAGSLKYLCQKAKCSRRKVTMVLPKLVEKGLIIKIDKEVRGVHLCEYRVSPLCMGGASDAPGGGACHAPKNIENKNIDNNSLYKGSSHFQKPTLEDIRAYCISRSNNLLHQQIQQCRSGAVFQFLRIQGVDGRQDSHEGLEGIRPHLGKERERNSAKKERDKAGVSL